MQTGSPIVAPSGVIAVFLGIINHTSLMENQEAEDWLTANDLIGYGADQVLAATPKGQAWASMIYATPLPVQVSQWSDPRGATAPVPAAAPDVLGQLVAAIAALAPKLPAAAPASKPQSMTSIARELAAAPLDPLPGFRPNEWTTLAVGQAPPGMQRDDRVIVQMRSGRVMGERPSMMASQIIWQHRESPDDVIYYRLLDRDDGISV